MFHFLTEPDQWIACVQNVAMAVKPGGHVIVSTFGPEGPTKCSGLDVMRYDVEALHDEFGGRFRLVESSKVLHDTPFGTTQQFLYCYCRLEQENRIQLRASRNEVSGQSFRETADSTEPPILDHPLHASRAVRLHAWQPHG